MTENTPPMTPQEIAEAQRVCEVHAALPALACLTGHDATLTPYLTFAALAAHRTGWPRALAEVERLLAEVSHLAAEAIAMRERAEKAEAHAEALERMIADLVDECPGDFEAMEKLCDEATPGPWSVVKMTGADGLFDMFAVDGPHGYAAVVLEYGALSEADSRFIVGARSALPSTLFVASQFAKYARADEDGKADMRAFHLDSGPAKIRRKIAEDGLGAKDGESGGEA